MTRILIWWCLHQSTKLQNLILCQIFQLSCRCPQTFIQTSVHGVLFLHDTKGKGECVGILSIEDTMSKSILHILEKVYFL